MQLRKKIYFTLAFLIIRASLLSQNYRGNYTYYVIDNKNDKDDFKPLFVIVFAIIALLFYFYREVYHTPQKYIRFLPFNTRNKLRAHVILGVRMIKLDRTSIKGQVNYLISFNKRLFPSKDVRYEYKKFVRGELYIDRILKWFNKHADEEDKIDLLDYLADLAYYGHRASAREINMLRHVANKLYIDGDVLGSILGIREERFDRKQKRNHSYNNKRKSTIKSALRILGLEKVENENAVKKAYRKMAKKFHPDRFQMKSEEEKKMAHERFIEINKAYDLLMEQ